MSTNIILHLLLFLLLPVVCQSSSTKQLNPGHDLSVLVSYLSHRYPDISGIKEKSVKLETLEFPEPVFQFASSSKSISFHPSGSEFLINLISLESDDYLIEQQPMVNYSYSRPVTIEIEFRPTSLGIKSDYLVVSTVDFLYVFHVIGTCVDSGFRISPIRIFHQVSLYGVSDLALFNPFDETIEKIQLKPKHKNISIEKTRCSIDPHISQDIGIVRSYFSSAGSYSTSVELTIKNFTFNIPVLVKVFHPQLDVPKKLDLGIVSMTNRSLTEDLIVRSFSTSHIKVINVHSLSKHFSVSFSPKNVPSLIEKFSICQVKFHSKKAGNFAGKLEVITAQQVFTVDCFVIVHFGFIYLPEAPFVLNPSGEVSYTTEIKNKIGIDLVFEHFTSNDKSILVYPKEKNFVELVLNSCRKEKFLLTAKTSLGNLHFSIPLTEPSLKFHKILRNQSSEVLGPVNLGSFSKLSNHSLTISVENSNNFAVSIDRIELLSGFSSSFKPSQVQAFSRLLIVLDFQVKSSIDDCLKLFTSFGEFFIHFVFNIVTGVSRVRALYFSDVMPLKQNEEYLYLVNSYPVTLNVFSVTSNYEDIQFDLLATTIPSQKELIISKAHFVAPLQTVPIIDWSKFVTFGDILTWKNVQTSCTDYQKIFEVSVETDIQGIVKLPVFLSYKNTQFPLQIFSKYSKCEVHQTCPYFIQVENPFAFPVTLQLVPSSDSLEEEIFSVDCIEESNDSHEDDEKFKFSSNSRKEKCKKKADQEVKIDFIEEDIKENQNLNSGLIEKIWRFFESIFLKNKQGKIIENQEFWHGSTFKVKKEHFTVKSGTKQILGPVYFSPKHSGDTQLPIILRNNYTVFQKFLIDTQATSPKLAIMKRTNFIFTGKTYVSHKNSLKKEQQKLQFHVTSEEFQGFYLTSSQMLSPTFFRTFEVHNQGNSDLVIEKISFENGGCSFLGFSVSNCEISLLLKPFEIYSIPMTYSPSMFVYTEPLFLSIFSSSGVKVFQIDHKLPESSGIELFLSQNSEELLILSSSLLIALLSLQIKSLKIKKVAKKSYSSKDLIASNCPQVFIKDFTGPVFNSVNEKITTWIERNAKDVEKNSSESLNSSESPKSIENLENPENFQQSFKFPTSKRPKTSKITKLSNVIKSEGKVKKLETKLPEVIANNKHLLAANSKRSVSDEPAPHPQEPESDEDCYLDSYKTRNILFGLPSLGEVSVLNELGET